MVGINRVEQMRAFIIKIIYFGLWAGIVFCLLKYAMPLFMPFVVAFVIAFVLKPVIRFVQRKTPLHGKPAAVVVLVLAYLVVGTLLVLLSIRLVIYLGGWFAELPRLYTTYIEPAIAQVGTFFNDFIVGLDPSMRQFLESSAESLTNSVATVLTAISNWAIGWVTGFAQRVPWVVVGTLLCIISSFFFVVDYSKITSFLTRQLPTRGRRLLFAIKDFVVNVLFRFGWAYLKLMSLTFAEVAVGLLIMRVPSAIPIALATAVVDILPVFGTGTIMIPWALYNLFIGNFFLGIGLSVLYIIITVVRQILEPRVVGKQIGLYPLLTLICMFIGTRLFGIWGLFGLPITLTVIIYLNRTGEIHLFREGPADDLGGPEPPEGPAPPPDDAVPAAVPAAEKPPEETP
ncbi:MAG: sporulation integral membrane protein YtvI [Oscillospiraceae bacterium]